MSVLLRKALRTYERITVETAKNATTFEPLERSRVDKVPRWLSVLGLGVFLLLLWQLAYSVSVISPLILPSPVETFKDFWFVTNSLFTGGYVAVAMLSSAQGIILGFLLAVLLGVVLGGVVGESVLGERMMMPYLVALDASPKIAFAPLLVAWLGFGLDSKVAMAAFVSFFPMMINSAAGLQATDRDELELFRSMQASRWQTLIHLKVRNALPYIFTGAKIAAVSAAVGAVVAEYLGGGTGMGELIRTSAQQLRIGRVLSLIFYLSMVGLLLFAIVGWLQRRTVFWQRAEKESGS